MVLKGVTIAQLLKELAKRGIHDVKVPKTAAFVCLKVALMGWSWAPAICHSFLEDILGQGVCGFPEGGQLIHGALPATFLKTAYIYWVFMDDWASTMLVESDQDLEELEKVRAAAAAALRKVGLDMHKDGTGAGLPRSLGVEIVAGLHQLRVPLDTIMMLVAATYYIATQKKKATGLQMSRLVGRWVWVLLAARPALSFLDATQWDCITWRRFSTRISR